MKNPALDSNKFSPGACSRKHLEDLSSVNIAKNVAKIILVGMAHTVIGVGLYYQRIIHQFSVFDSDILVFLAPMVFAFAGYFLVTLFCMFPKCNWSTRIAAAILIAFVATAISLMCTMTFAFNMWGS